MCTISMKKELKVIGRHIRFCDSGIEIEVDSKYAREALEAYDMQGCNLAPTPAIKPAPESREERRELLLRRVLEKEGPQKSEQGKTLDHDRLKQF